MASFWESICSSNLKDWDLLDPTDEELKKYDFPYSEISSEPVNSSIQPAEPFFVNPSKNKLDSVSPKKDSSMSPRSFTNLTDGVSSKQKDTAPTLMTSPSKLADGASQEKNIASVDVKDVQKILTSKKTYSKKKINPLIASNVKSSEENETSFSDEIACESEPFQITKDKESNIHEGYDNRNVTRTSEEYVKDIKSFVNNKESNDDEYSLFGDIDVTENCDTRRAEKNSIPVQMSSLLKVNKGYQRTRKNLKKQITNELHVDEINGKSLSSENANDLSYSTSNKEDCKENSESSTKFDLQGVNGSQTPKRQESNASEFPSQPKLSLLDMVRQYSETHNSSRSKNNVSSRRKPRKQKNKAELETNRISNVVDSSSTLPSNKKKAQCNKSAKKALGYSGNSFNESNTQNTPKYSTPSSSSLGLESDKESFLTLSNASKQLPQTKSRRKYVRKNKKDSTALLSNQQKIEISSKGADIPTMNQLSISNSETEENFEASQNKRKRKKNAKPTKLRKKFFECSTQTNTDLENMDSNNMIQQQSRECLTHNSSQLTNHNLVITNFINKKEQIPGNLMFPDSGNSNILPFQNNASPSKSEMAFTGKSNDLVHNSIPCIPVTDTRVINNTYGNSGMQLMWLPVWAKPAGYPEANPPPGANQCLFMDKIAFVPSHAIHSTGNITDNFRANTLNSGHNVVTKLDIVTKVTEEENSTPFISFELENNDEEIEDRQSSGFQANDFLAHIEEDAEFLKENCLVKCLEKVFSSLNQNLHMTVKEFCETPRIVQIFSNFLTEAPGFKNLNGVETSCMKYAFPDDFHDTEVISIMPEIVHSILSPMFPLNFEHQRIYVSNKSILEFAHRYMTFRECFMMEIVFCKPEMLTFKDLLVKLAFIAILMIFDQFFHRQDDSMEDQCEFSDS